MTTLVRVTVYSILPLVLAAGHIYLSREPLSRGRKIELFLLYVFALGVGAGGVGGFFGHFFLSDLVAESIGWEAGSPFQLEMGVANLVLGVLGFMAVHRRTDFRTATIVAVTVMGVGATIVHIMDIAATGNLAPGNTIQNFSNLIKPALLISLTWLASREPDGNEHTEAYAAWHGRQGHIATLSAIGASSGFGLGFWWGFPLLAAVAGALLGIVIAIRQTPKPALS